MELYVVEQQVESHTRELSDEHICDLISEDEDICCEPETPPTSIKKLPWPLMDTDEMPSGNAMEPELWQGNWDCV